MARLLRGALDRALTVTKSGALADTGFDISSPGASLPKGRIGRGVRRVPARSGRNGAVSLGRHLRPAFAGPPSHARGTCLRCSAAGPSRYASPCGCTMAPGSWTPAARCSSSHPDRSATVPRVSSSAAGAKPEVYYAQERADLVAQLPRPLGRVLDVGCGEGGAGRPLRDAGASWISGIELDPAAAARAAERYDEAVAGRAEESLDRVSSPFDTILLYDVLEHLAEPGSFLEALQGVAAPGARAHVSVPNARHWTLLRDLAVRGTFGYTEAGHRDETHLRWFTRSDLRALLERAGWRVERVEHGPLRPVSRLAERLSRGLTAELLVYQWSLLARAPGSAQEAAPSPAAG